MYDYLITLLNKTKLRQPVGSQLTYLNQVKSFPRVTFIAQTSFGGVNPGILPGSESPSTTVNYVMSENNQFLITEDNNNIIT
jgi:hypothetical protein